MLTSLFTVECVTIFIIGQEMVFNNLRNLQLMKTLKISRKSISLSSPFVIFGLYTTHPIILNILQKQFCRVL